MNLTKQKGFTLIELMIVVAIIGILASIAIPQFASFRVKAFNSAAQADVKNVGTAIEAYYSDNFVYPDAAVATGTTALALASATPGTGTATANLSEKVTVDLKVSTATASKRCISGKHLAGDTIMTSNTDALGVTAAAPVDAYANVALGTAPASIPGCAI